MVSTHAARQDSDHKGVSHLASSAGRGTGAFFGPATHRNIMASGGKAPSAACQMHDDSLTLVSRSASATATSIRPRQQEHNSSSIQSNTSGMCPPTVHVRGPGPSSSGPGTASWATQQRLSAKDGFATAPIRHSRPRGDSAVLDKVLTASAQGLFGQSAPTHGISNGILPGFPLTAARLSSPANSQTASMRSASENVRLPRMSVSGAAFQPPPPPPPPAARPLVVDSLSQSLLRNTEDVHLAFMLDGLSDCSFVQNSKILSTDVACKSLPLDLVHAANLGSDLPTGSFSYSATSIGPDTAFAASALVDPVPALGLNSSLNSSTVPVSMQAASRPRMSRTSSSNGSTISAMSSQLFTGSMDFGSPPTRPTDSSGFPSGLSGLTALGSSPIAEEHQQLTSLLLLESPDNSAEVAALNGPELEQLLRLQQLVIGTSTAVNTAQATVLAAQHITQASASMSGAGCLQPAAGVAPPTGHKLTSPLTPLQLLQNTVTEQQQQLLLLQLPLSSAMVPAASSSGPVSAGPGCGPAAFPQPSVQQLQLQSQANLVGYQQHQQRKSANDAVLRKLQQLAQIREMQAQLEGELLSILA